MYSILQIVVNRLHPGKGVKRPISHVLQHLFHLSDVVTEMHRLMGIGANRQNGSSLVRFLTH